MDSKQLDTLVYLCLSGERADRTLYGERLAEYIKGLERRIEFLEYRLGYRMEYDGQLPAKGFKRPTD